MAYQSQHTPAKPRQSGIPAPGARSGIPTPGATRPRSLTASSSGAAPALPTPSANGDMARALSDAIRANDPRQHNSKTAALDSPTSTTSSSYAPRKSAGGWLQTPASSARPGSAASSAASAKSTSPRTSDAGGTRMMQPTTPTSSTGARYAPRQSTTTPTYRTPSSSYAPRASTASSRPASRLSEAGGGVRAPSRAGRGFEVGDLVRIESIGMEGTLRYMGEIDGKPGAWAGVELAGGFAGRGKNDGSVNGVAYFSCPPKCGVFVATNKLSMPTTGAVRPSSVASSRGGRVTPAMSAGRVTPSPVPPRTPQFRTPAAPRQSITSRAGVTPKAADANKYTAGSRASKYAGMTARQLRGGDENRAVSPTGTPKPALSRPSFGGIKVPGMTTNTTPKPATRRTDMPPPASPALSGRYADVKPGTPTLSQTSTETAVDDAPETAALAAANRALQEKIAALTAGMASARAPTPRAPTPARAQTPAPDPRLEKLDAENAKLSAEVTALKGAADASKLRLAELESSLKTAERALSERTAKVEALERAAASAQADVDKARAEGETKARDLQGRLEHQEALVTSLRAALETTEGRKGESDALLEAKQTEITLLEARLEKSLREWDEERKELNLQVDELRLAGQETIALYEERLSASEQQKYELEDMLEAVNAKLKEAEAAQPVRAPSPTTRSTAAEIDNETLREQAVHLQQKIAALEDQLEEAQAAFEREEAAMRARVAKYKDADERLKRESEAVRAERDQARREGDQARQRVVELEEALRENGVALEDARADVEGLRAELANLASSNQAGGETLPTRLDEARKAERARVQEELATLKESLEATKASNRELQAQADAIKAERDEAVRQRDALKSSAESVNVDPSTIAELRASLDERAAELERLRKTQNRDRPLTPSSPLDGNFLLPEGAMTPRSSSKHDREEIAGLKHIVQDLTKETVSLQSQNRLLEKENKMLMSETEELRDAIKQLELTVEESILREERQLNGELQALDAVNAAAADLPTDVAELQRALQDLRIKFDTEVDALKKKLAAQEQKSARTIHDLNKELSELESLVEAKIYREDDLEREIERLKAKLERGHKSSSSKPSVAAEAAPLSASSAPASASTETVCEICEQPGHDIFTCHLLKDDPSPSLSQPSSARNSTDSDPSALWCDDCESHGHVAADCPHSLDVF